MTPEGVVTWTTPIGDQLSTWPLDHLGVRDLGASASWARTTAQRYAVGLGRGPTH